MKDPVFHKFPVFSVVDESDTVMTKYSNCNNCGAVHKVYDICKSEIVVGRDEIRNVVTVEDFKLSLPSQLFELLIQYEKDVCDFEYSQFIIDEKKWNTSLVLSREEVEDSIQGKCLRFLGEEKFRIESYTHKVSM